MIRKEKFTDLSGKKIVQTYDRGRGATAAPIVDLNSVEKTPSMKNSRRKKASLQSSRIDPPRLYRFTLHRNSGLPKDAGSIRKT
ncbi:hypothetical protein LEP1GSC060_0400 [Leptospira weilii serovar Ranarum str. ICFT]|uniref:Uncharacterized protein n=1 Tax=Leptospira weilii serovar Ranarum str. ICFT TaxID=1218598 RepID=N1WEI5_9LEPT|nr:hypothetical protein LEP1GSC060_0400 [Leptospira weilii serovar Ranarum str. ICFT]